MVIIFLPVKFNKPESLISNFSAYKITIRQSVKCCALWLWPDWDFPLRKMEVCSHQRVKILLSTPQVCHHIISPIFSSTQFLHNGWCTAFTCQHSVNTHHITDRSASGFGCCRIANMGQLSMRGVLQSLLQLKGIVWHFKY